MGFPRQEYWSGLPFPFPGDLPYPGIEPVSPALQADALLLSHQGSPRVCQKIQNGGNFGAGREARLCSMQGVGDMLHMRGHVRSVLKEPSPSGEEGGHSG